VILSQYGGKVAITDALGADLGVGIIGVGIIGVGIIWCWNY
jgi:hypothetical protein